MPKPPPAPLNLSPEPLSPGEGFDDLPSPDPSQSRFASNSTRGPSSFLTVPSAFPRAKIYSRTPLLATPAPAPAPPPAAAQAQLPALGGGGRRESYASSRSSSDDSRVSRAPLNANANATVYPGIDRRASDGSACASTSRATTHGHGYRRDSLAPLPTRHADCELCLLVNECRGAASTSTSTVTAQVAASSSKGPDLLHRSLSDQSQRNELTQVPQAQEVWAWERRTVRGREVLWHDPQITVYAARGKERVVDEGRHLMVAINTHAESVYQLGPVDVPLLSHILDTAARLLDATAASTSVTAEDVRTNMHVGFVGSVVRDPASPHAHLHAQAYLGPMDPGAPGSSFWRRNVVFAGVNWWSVQDLRAEIREETSNNRVKSGYANRNGAPIDRVPAAGSVMGAPNALENRRSSTIIPDARAHSITRPQLSSAA